LRFLFLGKGENEASSRYRIQPISKCLAEAGHGVEFLGTEMSLLDKLLLLGRLSNYDLVFVQRKLFPIWFIHFLAKQAKRLVFDFDDAIFLKSSGEDSATRHKKFQATCRRADLILAGNEYLAREATQFSDKVIVVPTTVDTETYVVETAKSVETAMSAETAEGSNITLVWIGSSSTRRYLDMLTPVLDQLGDRISNLSLKVIADFDLHLDRLNVNNVTWSESGEVPELTSSHIGIAPMINNGWTRGKCALKVIQYMAAGLPVVSDRCGANQEVIIEGETGFLADTEHDWLEAIKQLVENPDLRTQMGEAGRTRARQHYDMQTVRLATASRLVELCSK
tara:strand:+ start:67686 stop:68699 length:1014 start_codon:yes stop_codon:yes gene_type:complete